MLQVMFALMALVSLAAFVLVWSGCRKHAKGTLVLAVLLEVLAVLLAVFGIYVVS